MLKINNQPLSDSHTHYKFIADIKPKWVNIIIRINKLKQSNLIFTSDLYYSFMIKFAIFTTPIFLRAKCNSYIQKFLGPLESS